MPSSKPLKQKKAHSNRRRMMPAITPITIPAIAPPLRPLLLVVEVMPAALPAPDAEAVGAWKGTVVVAEPVEVTVVAALLVGRINAVAVEGPGTVVIEAK